LAQLKADDPWFASAGQTVGWFRKRRAIRFHRSETGSANAMTLSYDGDEIAPPVKIRIHRREAAISQDHSPEFSETGWNGIAGCQVEIQ
jgi:hypothetical protein